MQYEQIVVERRDEVALLTLNRPERLNAWTPHMGKELYAAFAAAALDDDVRVIVVTGAGRGFCAGADMEATFQTRIDGRDPGDDTAGGEGGLPRGLDWVALVRESKPLIAAVNGAAVGVGLTMILPFDVRIASTRAQFSIRFIKMGLIPELGSTRLLAQIVGLGYATDMCLTGRMVPADEALRMGLVTAVTEPDDLFETSLAKAEEIANNPSGAVMMIKELLAKNPLDPDLEAVMERELIRDQIARRLPDHAEAVAAFLEKREPAFNR